MKRAALIAVLLALTGCVSNQGGGGVFSWWTNRGERAVAKAEKKADDAREAQLTAARIEVIKADASAAALAPSREAELTQRFTANANDLLAQAVPGVTAEQLAAVRQMVTDLRSQDAKIVAAAEARQRSVESTNAELSRKLAATTASAASANARAAEIARENAQLAAELLRTKFIAAAGAVASAALGIAALAYRANAFGLATSAANMLADLQRKHGEGVASLARGALDSGLNRGEQTTIAKIFSKVAPDLVSRS